ncbi:MAG: hypothetical protein LBR78_03385 [Holosporales bacterium]|nr:hypothetical protein [Holosporales bacterium]
MSKSYLPIRAQLVVACSPEPRWREAKDDMFNHGLQGLILMEYLDRVLEVNMGHLKACDVVHTLCMPILFCGAAVGTLYMYFIVFVLLN